jgi:hypothetical protein
MGVQRGQQGLWNRRAGFGRVADRHVRNDQTGHVLSLIERDAELAIAVDCCVFIDALGGLNSIRPGQMVFACTGVVALFSVNICWLVTCCVNLQSNSRFALKSR